MLALGAIAAVVLLLIGIFGKPPDGGAGTTNPVGQSGTALPTESTDPSGSSDPGTGTASTTTTPAPPPAESPGTTAPTTSATVPAIRVVVLNSTETEGLASLVDEYLAGLGWQTGDPGNFLTRLDVTTVYYPTGQEAAAQQVADAAPGDGNQIAPAIPEVAADVLTVVLGADAVDWQPPT